jgi:Magnesium chelatase, subunit ChlI
MARSWRGRSGRTGNVSLAEARDTMRLYGVADLTDDCTAWVTARPCRAPHHTISDAGLIGGWAVPMLGEVSPAYHGVRCLDDLPECRRHGLEVLRQLLEARLMSRPSSARHPSHRAGPHGRDHGTRADHHRLTSVLPGATDAFHLTAGQARSRDHAASSHPMRTLPVSSRMNPSVALLTRDKTLVQPSVRELLAPGLRRAVVVPSTGASDACPPVPWQRRQR